MTPYEIGVIFHYYAKREDHPDVFIKPPIWRETWDSFLKNGLLGVVLREKDSDPMYELTERGEAYVHMLMSVPFPVLKWTWPSDWSPPEAIHRDGKIVLDESSYVGSFVLGGRVPKIPEELDAVEAFPGKQKP